jgi:adenylate kinase
MDKGELVPDATMIGLIKDTLSQLKPDQHVILDGFPRTVAQAEALNSNNATQVEQALLFEIADSLLIDRLTGRRVCKQCGQPFHMKHIRPKKEGVCDLCNGDVIQRSDDHEDVVRRRLEIFHSQNKGLVDYYSDKQKLKHINVDQPADSVQKILMELLK